MASPDPAPEPYVPPDSELKALLGEARTIAVVGLSPRASRPSNQVAAYLQQHGYLIVPVNPYVDEVLGERAYPSLLDIPDDVGIDVVDVFRRPEYTPEVAAQAVRIGARALWLQADIVNDEARRIAEEGGLEVVMGVCLRVEHRRLGV